MLPCGFKSLKRIKSLFVCASFKRLFTENKNIVGLIVFYFAESVAVMSVDLGSEWMKLAIVKPGVPMEIILNKYVCKI